VTYVPASLELLPINNEMFAALPALTALVGRFGKTSPSIIGSHIQVLRMGPKPPIDFAAFTRSVPGMWRISVGEDSLSSAIGFCWSYSCRGCGNPTSYSL
jgi:hypothetical protein